MVSRRLTGAVAPDNGNNRNLPSPLALVTLTIVIAAGLAIPLATASAQQAGSGGTKTQPKAKAPASKPYSGRVVRKHVMAGSLVKVRAKRLATGQAADDRASVRIALRVRREGSRRWTTVETLQGLTRKPVTLRWRSKRPGRYRAQAVVTGNGKRHVDPLGRFNVYRGGGASWYGGGGTTACGQRLTDSTMGVAHKTLPCGTKVTFRYRGRTATARVIDRGPFIAGRDWDLTVALKRAIGFGDVGQVLTTR
jgi:rare lipoprotein A (peptidoglycan hydrolase)